MEEKEITILETSDNEYMSIYLNGKQVFQDNPNEISIRDILKLLKIKHSYKSVNESKFEKMGYSFPETLEEFEQGV